MGRRPLTLQLPALPLNLPALPFKDTGIPHTGLCLESPIMQLTRMGLGRVPDSISSSCCLKLRPLTLQARTAEGFDRRKQVTSTVANVVWPN